MASITTSEIKKICLFSEIRENTTMSTLNMLHNEDIYEGQVQIKTCSEEKCKSNWNKTENRAISTSNAWLQAENINSREFLSVSSKRIQETNNFNI